MKGKILSVSRASIAVLSAAAILSMIVSNLGRADFSYVNLFSFFTVQSNIIVILTLLVTTFAQRGVLVDRVRGAATLYIIITGVIYHLLLRGADVQVETDWVNLALHTIAPLYMFIDWLIDPPVERIPLRRTFAWLIYPVVFAVYSLIRGAITDWYPYPFLNVADHGYARIALNSVVIMLGFLVLAFVVAMLPYLVRQLNFSSLKAKK